MSDCWYFAYGSNLSREQMENRTGRIRDARRTRLDRYRIAFNKRGSDNTGKANIVRDPNGAVWGVVYRCSPAALREMDRYEGVAGGHYTRAVVRVQTDAGDQTGKSFVSDHTLILDFSPIEPVCPMTPQV